MYRLTLVILGQSSLFAGPSWLNELGSWIT